MNRPWIIWLLSLCCAAGIFGAMGVVTHRSLTLEQEGAQARADAELQERLRLALWRMETEASALMIEENNRPPEHFRAVLSPMSPLAGPLPKHVRLHFDIGVDGYVTSPQVPRSGDARFAEAEQSLQHLRSMLMRAPNVEWCSSVMEPQTAARKATDFQMAIACNGILLDAAARNWGPFDPAPGTTNAPAPVQTQDVVANGAVQFNAPQQGGWAASPQALEQAKQQEYNASEMASRAKVYSKVAEGKNFMQNVNPSSSQSLVPMDKDSLAEGKAVQDARRQIDPKVAASSASRTRSAEKAISAAQAAPKADDKGGVTAATPPPAQLAQNGVISMMRPEPTGPPTQALGSAALQKLPGWETQQGVPAPAPGAGAEASRPEPGTAPTTSPAPVAAPQMSSTPFRPFWLEDELFLVREVAEAGRRHVQGVWLDAASLKTSLLEAVTDILPQAVLRPVSNVAFMPTSSGQLLPSPAVVSGDPMELVGLPWKLVPGEKAVAVVRGWTPMRLTLAAAWLGALLAVLAAAALLFGVTRLSERRAAFVSSVTHELRTPLTTFRLYSELLEQGMVREEADRTQYLHTLRTEAERLTHLVDNVLAYSRIERTNRRARMERLDLVSWLERVKPRLEDRTREAGMQLDLHVAASTEDELASVTDATALEQIVFNLVDNACKYAAGRCAVPVVRVALERRGRTAELRVCDSGPGIARGERSKLFRPFHKSADEAANSKPGVGLGLALCHRLAKALGGKLVLEKPKRQEAGACFVLRLPME